MEDVLPGFEALVSGPKLSLPDVTLICVDTAYPELALRAVRHCMRQIDFGDSVLITRPGHRLADIPPGLGLETTDTIRSVADYSRFILRGLLPYVQTSHCLVVQWDGLIVDTSAWDPRFLELDYIGAILLGHPAGHRVGNGGFSLRSRRLLQALQDPAITRLHSEDVCVADTYRELLEQRYGIRFADEATAQRFAMDGLRAATPVFGLHGLDTLHWYLPEEGFRRFAAAIPGYLFGGGGARRMIRDAIARKDGRLALYVLQQRRRRKDFWSCAALWLPVWWTWLRSRLRVKH